MFIRLLLIFSIIPLIELALLIKVGGYLGIIPTIILVAGTGVVGVSLARSQGFQLIQELKLTLKRGELPADHLIQGLLILIGAAMLLTPGLLTDTVGFLLIIPPTRRFTASYVRRKIRKWIEKGKLHISYDEYRNPYGTDDYNYEDSIDVDFEEK
ncbi:FxsA protein [Anoxybacter fermentans]|uniref:FxsA protein n=1 Tax=Anoxybacter fermentans TaxID=1323375 RepID=A0A3Q9HSA5_9FIRM|nr:FxsA family protein [Anoxybacter fermentans]AZR74624.1 FxsA protein [Anoxybacter fermentans]